MNNRKYRKALEHMAQIEEDAESLLALKKEPNAYLVAFLQILNERFKIVLHAVENKDEEAAQETILPLMSLLSSFTQAYIQLTEGEEYKKFKKFANEIAVSFDSYEYNLN